MTPGAVRAICAILCIAAVLITALIKEVDGMILLTGVAAMSGLGGWAVGIVNKRISTKRKGD